MISGYEISDEYIALNPTQIKSATDTGAFDNNNNSICRPSFSTRTRR